MRIYSSHLNPGILTALAWLQFFGLHLALAYGNGRSFQTQKTCAASLSKFQDSGGLSIFISMFFLLSSFFSVLFAEQPCKSAYSFNDVWTLTLLNNPELKTFSYDLRASDAKILQSSLYPNPGLDVESEDIHRPIMQTTFLLSQQIELGGKRQARMNFAKMEQDKTFVDYEVKKRELFVETSLLFIETLIQQQKISFLEESLKGLQDFSQAVDKRVKAGKASPIEEANFIVLLSTAELDLKDAQRELKNAKLKLAAQWSAVGSAIGSAVGSITDAQACVCSDSFSVTGNLDWPAKLISLEEMGKLIQEHPQIARFSLEYSVRKAQVALEKSMAYPDVNVRGGPRYLKEDNKWTYVVGVAIPLPINDRNQGKIWEARENLEKLEHEKDAVWVKLLTELNTSYLTIQKAEDELYFFKNKVLPAAQKAYDFSHKGYELARYNYLEMLETEKMYRASQMRYIQALGEYHKALAILQGLIRTN